MSFSTLFLTFETAAEEKTLDLVALWYGGQAGLVVAGNPRS